MNATKIKLLVLVEGDRHVAVCLDRFLTARGEDADQALRAFANVVAAQHESDVKRGVEPLSTHAAAPRRYHELYEAGTPLWDVELRLDGVGVYLVSGRRSP